MHSGILELTNVTGVKPEWPLVKAQSNEEQPLENTLKIRAFVCRLWAVRFRAERKAFVFHRLGDIHSSSEFPIPAVSDEELDFDP